MIVRRLALLTLMLGLLMYLGLIAMNPAASTLDVGARTDIVEFDTLTLPRAEPTVFAATNALICGGFNPTIEADASKPCTVFQRPAIKDRFSGSVELQGSIRVQLRRLRDKELEIAVIRNEDGTITLQPAQNMAAGDDVVIVLNKASFEESDTFSLVTRASTVVIGEDGRTFGRRRGLFLVGGTATPLATALFSDDVIRGSTVPLSAGDIVSFNGGGTAGQYASLFVRAEPGGPLHVGARFPMRETKVSSFAGAGVPISISWWERLKADPVLLALSAMVGMLLAIPDWKKKIRTALDSLWKRKPKKRSLRLVFLAVAALQFGGSLAASAQPVFVEALSEEGQGFVFRSEGRCFAITALHVVESAGKTAPELKLQSGNLTQTARIGPDPRLPPHWSKQWRYPELDIAVIDIGDTALCRAVSGQARRAPDQDQLVVAGRAGAVEYIPARIAGEKNDKILVFDPTAQGGTNCPFFRGRSGSLVMSRNGKLLGLITRTDSCAGLATPIDRINSVLGDAAGIRLPQHARSTEFVQAAGRADEKSFVELLNIVRDPNSVDGSGVPALAAVASPRDPDPSGRLSDEEERRVCRSLINSRLRIARQLLQGGARVDGNGGDSWTPLMNAVSRSNRCGNSDMIELLLQSKATPNHIYKSQSTVSTPLMVAVERGTPEGVKLLLNYGADPEFKDKNGNTLIMNVAVGAPEDENRSACALRENDVVRKFKLLVAKGADLTKRIAHDVEYQGRTLAEVLRRRSSSGTTPGGQECFRMMLDALR
jgi:hypothetical protein